MTQRNPGTHRRQGRKPAWKLAEAKAKFSEIVRLATSGRPQRVTVRGRDAVVVVDAKQFDELQARTESSTLHELLSRSPLDHLEFEEEGVRGPVREACGWVTPALAPGSEPPRGGPPVATLSELLKELEDQRSDR